VLEREVVALFLLKSLADLERLKSAAIDTARREAAHAIGGSARAVGAGKLARLAAEVEGGAGGRALDDLEEAVVEARAFLSEHLHGRETVRV